MYGWTARNTQHPDTAPESRAMEVIKLRSRMTKLLANKWWPFGLLVGGGILLWGLGYSWRDAEAIALMALLIMGVGGYLVMAERERRG